MLLGNGDGTFQAAVNYAAGSDPYFVAVGDFSGDGKADLAVADDGGGVSVLLGNGNGTFQPAVAYAAGASPESVAVGDLNGDGNADLAVADHGAWNGTSYGGGAVSILLGNGNGTFQPATIYAVGYDPSCVALGDFNGHGKVDLAITSLGKWNGSTWDYAVLNVLLNNSVTSQIYTINASHLAFTSQPTNVVAGMVIYPPIFVNMENASGNTIAGDNSAITLSLSGGTGTLSGTVTVNAVNGVAEFSNLSINAAGTYTLQATHGLDANATSNAFAVACGSDEPMYRLYSPVTKEHLYTVDSNEVATLLVDGWLQDTPLGDETSFYANYPIFHIYSGLATVGGVSAEPWYRLYNTAVKQHLWTTDPNEYATLAIGNWQQEGIVGYVFPSAVTSGEALYRMSYGWPPLHLWTADANEYSTLAADYGWTPENVIGYVLTT